MQKKKKEEGAQFVFNYHTPPHEPNNPTYFGSHSLFFLPFVSDRENNDMILIIRSNICCNY